MATEAQILANRLNSTKSTGPTPASIFLTQRIKRNFLEFIINHLSFIICPTAPRSLPPRLFSCLCDSRRQTRQMVLKNAGVRITHYATRYSLHAVLIFMQNKANGQDTEMSISPSIT